MVVSLLELLLFFCSRKLAKVLSNYSKKLVATVTQKRTKLNMSRTLFAAGQPGTIIRISRPLFLGICLLSDGMLSLLTKTPKKIC